MTGNRQYFNKIDETISGKVRFEDDSRIDIKGKGSILFLTQNGERKILANVYFIPDLRSIIISLRQATESGCDVRMRSDVLTLHDKDGNLIIRAMRSKNRLYKVLMEIDEACCLKLRGQDDSTRWHATLGHIGVDTMKAMIGKELVTGIPKLKVEEKLVNHVCLVSNQGDRFHNQHLIGQKRYLNLFMATYADLLHHPQLEEIGISSCS